MKPIVSETRLAWMTRAAESRLVLVSAKPVGWRGALIGGGEGLRVGILLQRVCVDDVGTASEQAQAYKDQPGGEGQSVAAQTLPGRGPHGVLGQSDTGIDHRVQHV